MPCPLAFRGRGMALLVGGAVLAAPTKRAAHKLCLDFEFGNDLYDASRADGGGQSCSEVQNPCPGYEVCVSFSCTPEKGEDYGRDEGDRPFPAMRTLARVLDEELFLQGSPASVLWGWDMLDDDGCTTGEFPAEDVEKFRVQYFLWSENPTESQRADRNYTLGYACSGMPNLASCVQAEQDIEDIEVDVGGTTTVTRTFNDPGQNPAEAAHYAYWSATFAEYRVGQPEVVPLADRENVYVSVDAAGVFFPGSGTSANRVYGGQPTIWAKGEAWRYKFVIAHELGHIIVQFLKILGFSPAHFDYSLDGQGHGFDTIEWSAAAANEGFANFYALAIWHDLLASTGAVGYPFRNPNGALLLKDLPQTNPTCQTCDPGTSNESDWAGALVAFLRDASEPPLSHVLGMNAEAHDDGCIGLGQLACGTEPTCTWSDHQDGWHMCVGWPVTGQSSDYWDQFDDGMQGYLTTAEYDAWDGLANDHEIAQ